jgi:molybdopterin-guanine dinucleotide biosynthesis protein A
MHFGGVVLCGGKSTRMGFPKALLPFGDEVMLQRVVRIVREVVSPVVVVAAPGQTLPELPPQTLIAYDRREERGPLEGLRAGLSALSGRCDAVYVSSCDAPRLSPALIRRMTELLGVHQIAVPCDGGFCHPLAAIYRLDVAPLIEQLLSADRLRPAFLFDETETLRVPLEELRAVDADLSTLANLNHPSDYLSALAAERLPPDPAILEEFSRLENRKRE